MKITKRLLVSSLTFALICTAASCFGANTSLAAETESELSAENESASDSYEEQEEIPTVESVIGLARGSKSSMKTENGKYLELCYSYRIDSMKDANAEQVISEYVAFVKEQGFSAQEVASADDYAVLNADYHFNKDENEQEIYHILNDTELAAVLSYNDKLQSLQIYLMDAWEPGTRPDRVDPEVSKDTAYKTGTVYVVAYRKDPYSVYDFTFTDGALVAQTHEDYEGKGGYSEDTGIGIEHSPYYGMTVEEISQMLEKEGYQITVGDDLYDTMMRSISN